jgi:hypothetical protein
LTGNYPSGASIDPASGAVTWAPTTFGAFAFHVKFSDPFQPTLTETAVFYIDVSAPRPTAAPTPPFTMSLGGLSTLPNFAEFPIHSYEADVYTAVATAGWVRVFDYGSSQQLFQFQPYAGFTGSISVAVADVTGDSIPEIITAPGAGGGPDVKVFNGSTGAQIASFYAFGADFRGGVYLAAGDLDRQGYADIVATPGPGGGPVVAVFDGKTDAELAQFYAFAPTFRGGLRVAVGDVNGDGAADVVVTAGPGGGPVVAVFAGPILSQGNPARLYNDFYALDPSLRMGFYVTVGDSTGAGYSEIFLSADQGGGPRVVSYNVHDWALDGGPMLIASIFAGNPADRSGLRISAVPLNGDGTIALLTAEGYGALPIAYIYEPLTGKQRDAFYAWTLTSIEGVEVG